MKLFAIVFAAVLLAGGSLYAVHVYRENKIAEARAAEEKRRALLVAEFAEKMAADAKARIAEMTAANEKAERDALIASNDEYVSTLLRTATLPPTEMEKSLEARTKINFRKDAIKRLQEYATREELSPPVKKKLTQFLAETR